MNAAIPRAYVGSTVERDWKDLLRYRVGLARIGTRLRVRLRNIAQRYGAKLQACDVDSAKGALSGPVGRCASTIG